jgi:hypothetical protein
MWPDRLIEIKPCFRRDRNHQTHPSTDVRAIEAPFHLFCKGVRCAPRFHPAMTAWQDTAPKKQKKLIAP